MKQGIAIRIVTIVAVLGLARPAAAHDVRGEVVFLDVGERAVGIEVQVPILQLALARHAPIGKVPAATVAADQAALRAYARQYVGARSRDGREFGVDIHGVTAENVAGHDVVVFRGRLTAPDGADARWFEVRDDLVLHEVVTDTAYVFLRTDLQSGVLGEAPTLLDYLHYQRRSLVVDRTPGTRWRSFTTVFHLGMEHIADGTDHLLFLLVLLIPAPLQVRGGRWRDRRGARAGLVATARIVTAFTVGHSITLVIGAAAGPVLPGAVVETLIAVSILVTAGHALRPLFPGREALIAGTFGLVHGLAFAITLDGFGVDGPSLAIGVLGFNLGVEAMQLIVLVVTIPWLLQIARHGGAYRCVRILGAACAGIASLAWIAERTAVLRTPVPAFVERMASHAVFLLGALALVAIVLATCTARANKRSALVTARGARDDGRVSGAGRTCGDGSVCPQPTSSTTDAGADALDHQSSHRVPRGRTQRAEPSGTP